MACLTIWSSDFSVSRANFSRVMPVYAAHQRLATLGIPVLGAVFMEQNNPGYDSYTYSEGSVPGQNSPLAPPVMQ